MCKMMFMLSLFLLCLHFHHSIGNDEVQREFIIAAAALKSGQSLTIRTTPMLKVYEELLPYCNLFINEQACHKAMDDMSHMIYNVAYYTHTRKSQAIEDFVSSKSDVILYLLQRYNYNSYLEIGCDRDEVFFKIQQQVAIAHGIDPERGGTHRLTSNEFFKQNVRFYDLIFIDGDHNANQVILDIHNALRYLSEGGTILMHDSNPRHENQQIFPMVPHSIHNGDVWKVVSLLRLQDGLEVITIDIDYGLTIIRRRKNHVRLPIELEKRILVGYPLQGLTYSDLQQHRDVLLRLVTMAEFRHWLDQEETAINFIK